MGVLADAGAVGGCARGPGSLLYAVAGTVRGVVGGVVGDGPLGEM